jgi:hypothetical protein
MDPDADPDPAIFVIDLQNPNKKQILKKSFSAYYFLNVPVHLHRFTQIKSPTSHKTVGIKFFRTILLDDRRIRILEAQKHVDPVDPDPQH